MSITDLTERLEELRQLNKELIADAAKYGVGPNPVQVQSIYLVTLADMLLGDEESEDRIRFEIEFESRMNAGLVDLAAQARIATLTAPGGTEGIIR